MTMRAIALKPARIGIIWALLAVNLLGACTHGQRKDAENDIAVPPSFATTNIRMGMSLEEAKAAYPQQKPDWFRPHLIGFQFTQWEKISAAPAGMVVLPIGAFRDERLGTILSIVAFKGKRLERSEIDRIHGELLKECEAQYGADHLQAVTRKSSTNDNDYSKIIWSRPNYKATLILAHVGNQLNTQKIAALEIVAIKKQATRISLPTLPVDVMRALFGGGKF